MFQIACLLIFAYLSLVQPIRGNFRLQILHNNDLHARFVETDTYSSSCPEDFVKEGKCFGGFARMKQAADDAVREAKQHNISSIFLNGGDSFQGTPYYTMYKWQIVSQLIEELGFDIMALGNHEFDDGIDNLVNYLKNIKTPVVCANINVTSEKRLDLPILAPSKIITVEGRKIGVIGYLTPDSMEISNTENLQIFPEIPYIRAEAKRLKAEGIKIIIALGHSGFRTDVKIAEEVEEVSVVVGAHSHSLLYSPKDHPPSTEQVTSEYPTMVTQKSGKIVPVVQAYAYSKYLGRLLVEFDNEGNVDTATGNTHLLDYHVNKDPELDKKISVWEGIIKSRISVVEGYTRTFLKTSNFNQGKLESNLANLVTDAFVDFGVQLAHESQLSTWIRTPIALYQNGGIRTQIDHKKNKGAMTLEDLMTVLPFSNKLVEIVVRGSTIKKALELSVSSYDSSKDYFYTHFVHFSGLRVVYDFTRPADKRLNSVKVLCTNCSIPKFEPLTDDVTYRVITNKFLADGGDMFDMLKNERLSLTKIDQDDLGALVRYIEKNKVVYPKEDERITVTGFALSQPTKASNNATSSSTVPLFLIASFILLRMCFF